MVVHIQVVGKGYSWLCSGSCLGNNNIVPGLMQSCCIKCIFSKCNRLKILTKISHSYEFSLKCAFFFPSKCNLLTSTNSAYVYDLELVSAVKL